MEDKIYEVLKKHKLSLKKREALMKDLLPLYNVMPRFKVNGKFPSGKDFEYEDCAKDAECFDKYVRTIYPTLIINSISYVA